MELKVITFNIWDLHFGPNKDRQLRFERLIPKILDLDADIICLQESWDVAHQYKLRKALSLKYYMTLGDGEIKTRHVVWKKFDTSGGLVVLSKFPIKSWHFTPFTRRANFSPIEFFARKGFLTALLDTPAGPLEIVNTHIHALEPGHKIIQKKQLAELLSSAGSNPGNIPAIIAGDFNKNKMMFDPFYFELISGKGFIEPAHFHKNGAMPTHRPDNIYAGSLFYPAIEPVQFDYFLTKNFGNPADITVKPLYFEPPLSDHDPLVLTLSLNRG